MESTRLNTLLPYTTLFRSWLRALDRLWERDLGVGKLAELGLRLGADVPVCVHGRNAWAEEVGERLTPLDLPPAWYVLADPGVHVATAELFQSPELTRNAPPATISDFISGASLGNAFEPVLRRREPTVESRSEERSVGKECVSTCRSRWSPWQYKKKK